MGIRNLAGRKHPAAWSALITPHGDSEQAAELLERITTEPHNPSWGFGTCLSPDPRHPVSRLITPHGDSEHAVIGLAAWVIGVS